MGLEIYTGYTEVDAASRLTVAANDLTVTALDTDENMYLYRDLGASYFSGDFSHSFSVRVTAVSGSPFLLLWALWNTAGNAGNQIVTPTGPMLAVYTNGSEIVIVECEAGSTYTDLVLLSINTTYHIRVTRDESVGTYGTLYLHVYSDSQYCSLLATKSITLTAATDYRYLYAASSKTGGGGFSISAVISDLSLDPYPYSLGTLITRVRDMVNEDIALRWTDAEIKRYLNDALRDVSIRAMCVQNIDSLTTSTLSTVTFTRTELLDATNANLRATTFSGYRVEALEYAGLGLTRVYQQMYGHIPSLAAPPAHWFTVGNNLYVGAVPGTAYSLTAYVVGSPSAEMSLNPDVPDVPPPYRPLLVLYAASQCKEADGRVDHANVLFSVYISEVMYTRWAVTEIIPDIKAMTNFHEYNKLT